MEKRLIKFIFVLAIFIFLINICSALRVGPAKVEYNFAPGFETSVTYYVSHNNPDTEFELYVAGDLSDYVKLDKDKLVGGGSFIAAVNLPLFIEKPGKHRILIGVREKISEKDLEVSTAMVRTTVTIQAVIDVYVAYPGKYLEISLSSNNANVGEPVNFELGIISQGKEDVNVTPQIDIISDDKTIETLYFMQREIKSQEQIKLKKSLDTADYNPGTYNALAIVDYGKIAKAESVFKIGELIIHLVNYTRQIIIGDVQKLNLEIESGWNDKVDGVYAEVFILNGSTTLISFETSSTSLEPWEKKTIAGFFDTSNFTKGFYNANITFIYYGKDIGKSSSELVKIEFVEEKNNFQMILFIAIGAVLLLVILGIIIKKYFLGKRHRLVYTKKVREPLRGPKVRSSGAK
ncbi:hypothetical protein KAT80_02480 [Candidatus Pacearchaeota archaeon]|nr:hypothetical protein [Candidatus Pacearchaeota archaeon]